MYDLKTILLAKRIRRKLDVTRLSVADIALLEIIKNASDNNPVRNATIENGIATFGGVVVSQPLVSLLLNIPVTQTGSGTPSPDNIRDFVGVSQAVISRTGTNLWDEEWEVGSYKVQNGEKSNSDVQIRCKNLISILPNTEYYKKTPSPGIYWNLYYDKNKNYLSYDGARYDTTFITPSNAYYMAFYTEVGYGTTYNHDISINYPSTDTDYHAYTGNTYQITFGQTVYSAILDVLTGKLILPHFRKAMSDLEWKIVTDEVSGFGYDYFRSSGNIEDMNPTAFPVVSDCLVNNKRSRNELLDNEIGRYNSSNFNRRLVCRADSITTIEDWNTFIADKYIVYELAEPIEIDLTPTVINTLIGENVIFANVADVTECKYTRK